MNNHNNKKQDGIIICFKWKKLYNASCINIGLFVKIVFFQIIQKKNGLTPFFLFAKNIIISILKVYYNLLVY